MRIAICDDMCEHLENIKNAILKYFNFQKNTFEIETFNHAFDFLDIYEKTEYDLVILDVCMPGMLGTSVAKEMRMRNNQTEIIFITSSNEFALEAFEVNAVHYLLKPFTQDAFDEAMDRVLRKIDHRRVKTVYLKGLKGVVHLLDKNKISYIEADAHRQNVYLNDGTRIEIFQTINELYQKLEDLSSGQFIMPYKGFIVNQNEISTIEHHKILLKNGKMIPMPRRTFSLIKQAYFDYMFGARQ